MHKIIITDDALENLADIWNYIALDNLFYAQKVNNDILQSINILETFPYIWKEFESWLYQIVNPKYKFKIVYQVEEKMILVLAIFREQDNWH
jgi:plasmid stabilization system protein ParE